MVGSATFTIATSRTTMNWAATRTASPNQRFRSAAAFSVLVTIIAPLIQFPLNRLLVPRYIQQTILRYTYSAMNPEMSQNCLPREMLARPAVLLGRLGTAMKMQSMERFEAAGFSVYHYGVLAVLDEGERETQATIA